QLVQVRGHDLADRLLEPGRLAPDGGPVPPGVVGEGLLVGLHRQPYPGRGLAAVLAAALVAGALDAHVLGAGHGFYGTQSANGLGGALCPGLGSRCGTGPTLARPETVAGLGLGALSVRLPLRLAPRGGGARTVAGQAPVQTAY